MSALRDPLWRVAFFRAGIVALVAALAATAGLGWGILAGVVAALLVTAELEQRVRPLRRRLLQLAEGRQSSPNPSLPELAALVEETRERLADERRKAELERDDVLGILEATSEGILVIGHHHRIAMINDAARRLLDPPVEPLGRALHEVIRDRDVLEFAQALRRGEEPAPRQVELALRGGSRWLHLSGSEVSGDRVRSRAVLVLHDLTDLQRLERVRTDFVANVTHEMRSPLASILGYAETLEMDAAIQAPEARDHLARILRNAHRLDGIIRDLIELSRLEHATAPEVEPTDVEELVRETTAAFGDQASAKSIELRIEPSPGVELLLDAGLVRQALTNLIDNAVKYTPERGLVRVTSTVRPTTEKDGRLLEIEVSDTGPGIPIGDQKRVFERFYRVDTARSRALGGTGLGLAIVKHAAALHGGSVRLESGAAGSTFRLSLPARPA